MSAHTPGPWYATETNDIFADEDEGTGNDPIASVHDREGSQTAEGILEGKANAKLIAAAPELVEALHAALSYLYAIGASERSGQGAAAVRAIKAALAKAAL
jgi:hypothetical protein